VFRFNSGLIVEGAREPVRDFRHRHLALAPFGNLPTFLEAQVQV
jgi:hypothetical protein